MYVLLSFSGVKTDYDIIVLIYDCKDVIVVLLLYDLFM